MFEGALASPTAGFWLRYNKTCDPALRIRVNLIIYGIVGAVFACIPLYFSGVAVIIVTPMRATQFTGIPLSGTGWKPANKRDLPTFSPIEIWR